MQEQELISTLIDLEEQAKAHTSEYLRLVQMSGNLAKASFHNNKALKLRLKIKGLMKKIALFRGDLHHRVFDKSTHPHS